MIYYDFTKHNELIPYLNSENYLWEISLKPIYFGINQSDAIESYIEIKEAYENAMLIGAILSDDMTNTIVVVEEIPIVNIPIIIKVVTKQ